MKIAFFEIEPWEQTYFEKHLGGNQLTFSPERLKLENYQAAEGADIVSVFIGSKVNAGLMEKLPQLKAVVTRSTGTDHIDCEAAKDKKIRVMNVPHYGVNTVAEHAFALMLALSRKLIPAYLQTKEGDFTNKNLTGFDLNGKTLGIIGYGNIGGKVAEIALAIGMNVLVYTRTPKEVQNVEFTDLETLLKRSDIITLHTPLTPETKHIINRDNLKLVKKGTLLINTARGGLVETEGLVAALSDGTLGGAGLDVLEEEQAIKEERQILSQTQLDLGSAKTLLLDHILLDTPNVIITPHNAFNSIEALEEINSQTVENIKELTKSHVMGQIEKVFL